MTNNHEEYSNDRKFKMFSANLLRFSRTELHGTVLKQPLRIEYLIIQKSRGELAGKQVLTEGLHK